MTPQELFELAIKGPPKSPYAGQIQPTQMVPQAPTAQPIPYSEQVDQWLQARSQAADPASVGPQPGDDIQQITDLMQRAPRAILDTLTGNDQGAMTGRGVKPGDVTGEMGAMTGQALDNSGASDVVNQVKEWMGAANSRATTLNLLSVTLVKAFLIC